MKFKPVQIITPASDWFPRWVSWLATGFVSMGYLSAILTTQHLTLFSLLLLTGIYGTWLVVYHIGLRQSEVRTHPGWLLALFCLACASQCVPLPGTNVYWLPLLSTITASMMTMLRPRFLSLLAVGVLCLSSYLAVLRIVPDWEASGRVLLLLSFLTTYGYVMVIRELGLAHTAKDAANANLAEAHARLREYSFQVEELSAMRERNRIAREIHDTLGHALTLLSVQLETATQLEVRGDPRLHEELLQARQVAKSCLTDVRHSVEALRPDDLPQVSLQEQLQRLIVTCEAICPETRITLDLEEATHPLAPELCQVLYRCTQEALTNIRKYAYATKVLVSLRTSNEQAELTVLDNGRGSLPEHKPGFGLLGMRERVAPLGGTLRAGPEPGHGWRVEVVLPLAQRGQIEESAMKVYEIRESIEQ